MDRQTTSIPVDDQGAPEENFEAELHRSREEVLKLRDLLISKDAELGILRGRIAELEASSARLLGPLIRLRTLFFGFGRSKSGRKTGD